MEAKQAFEQINAGNNMSVEVPYELTVNHNEYKGIIQFRFPSVRDDILIGLEESKLRGTLIDFAGRPELVTVSMDSLDNFTQFLVEGLATLKVLAITDDRNQFDKFPQEVIVEIHRGYLQSKNGQGEIAAESNTSDPGNTTSETAEQGIGNTEVQPVL